MKTELDEKLVKDFPNLYCDRYGKPNETSMCWGFSCSDGWYQIIYDVSAKLEALILQLPESERKNYRAVQVKEKFGGLRIYLRSATDEMDKLIGAAEDLSYQTCEMCGQPGQVFENNPPWVRTHCEPCEAKYQQKRKPVKSEGEPVMKEVEKKDVEQKVETKEVKAEVKSEAPKAFSTNDLLGQTQAEAEKMAKAAGKKYRIAEVDGKANMLSMDINPERLNFSVSGGKITGIKLG